MPARRHVASLVLVGALAIPAPAAATKMTAIVRGAGAGSDKAAAFVGHYVRHLLEEDGRYEVIDNSERLGADAGEAARAFREAEELVRKAMSAYETLELDPAIEHLTAAVQKYDRNAAHVTDVEPVAGALMLLGAVHILSGQEKTGGERLAQAVALLPTIEPDPRIFNPSMRQMFQRAADQVTRRPRGTLSVTSTPGYAELYVDGVFRGVTPASVEQLPPGRHYVRLLRDGYRSYGAVVTIPSGRELVEDGVLRPAEQLDDYDRAVTAAMGALEGVESDDDAADAVMSLQTLLGAEQVFLAEVQLDAEQVKVHAAQYDLRERRRLKAASHVFPYDLRGDVVQNEMANLLRTQFGETTLSRRFTADVVAGVEAADGGSPCLGMSCERFRRLALLAGGGGGVALASTGALLYVLASRDEDRFEGAVQGSPEASSIRSAGKTKALIGDIVLPIGVVAAAMGVGTYFLYRPGASADSETTPERLSASFSVVPLVDGGVVIADVRF